ncbi:hypothetical protein CDL12_08076 [Handroanthus impetiginosus]|uniref:Uncharacterized protein n=1 Tax=Handroanthus impetiginosus TaxID=429701 RepID=A0A2G9HP01_9LAMI|nr:hypothetical protein CDL12_08076 [Handroanthus impetiginosus]
MRSKISVDYPKDPEEEKRLWDVYSSHKKSLEEARRGFETSNAYFEVDFSWPSIAPPWKILENSSMVHSRPGEASFELYKGIQLPRDHVALSSVNMGRLEELGAHSLIRATSYFHQMSLQCAGWMDAFYSREVEVNKLKDQKTELEDKLKSIQDSWDQETASNREKLLGYERQIYELQQKYQQLVFEKEETYERGQADGKKNFLKSSEYVSAIKQARLDGARDFMNSQTFQALVDEKAAEYGFLAFMKCQAQIEHLSGFKDGFDVGQLDVTKTADLRDYVPDEDVGASTVEDEFATLLPREAAAEEDARSPKDDTDEEEMGPGQS